MPSFHVAGPLAGLTALMLALQGAAAQDIRAGDLMIQQPWMRATPGGAAVAGGYLTVTNQGHAPDRLMGASMDAAGRGELHSMTSANGVMQMRPTGPLAIPAGSTLTLSPNGQHIMFSGLKRGLKAGKAIAGTLTFEHAGPVPVAFTVEAIGARQPSSVPAAAAPATPTMKMNRASDGDQQ